jgi:hypothetical protein
MPQPFIEKFQGVAYVEHALSPQRGGLQRTEVSMYTIADCEPREGGTLFITQACHE